MTPPLLSDVGHFYLFYFEAWSYIFLLLFEFVFTVKSQLFLIKHEYLSLKRAVVQMQRWAQSLSITSGVGPGFVLEESILRCVSCTRQEEKKAGCLSAQSHRSACSYPAVGEFVLLAHWETLAKEGKFS